jgi:nickel/cobalt transporter (NicO) family protein
MRPPQRSTVPDISAIIQGGASNPWLYLPAAAVLGALHALEPGHSKSLMAAFIVAVRGTPAQATLLGVSAAIGHTIVVWALAFLGLAFGSRVSIERLEPWLLLLSGVLIIVLALRLLVPDRAHGHALHHHDHGDDHQHDHGHTCLDAHAAAHEREIGARFGGRSSVTNSEIAWFGFTGGLLPCPAAIAVLLVCLQLKAFTLGVAMVAAFSLGLAATLVAVGVAAVWGTQKATARWPGFDAWAERLPMISALIVLALGVLMALGGLWQLGMFGTV